MPLPMKRNTPPLLLLLALLSLPSLLLSTTLRNKEIDENYQRLIPLEQIPVGCDHSRGVEAGAAESAKEYGFVQGMGLEKCRVWLEEEQSASEEDAHYERYKCKHLRVHGHFNEESGKCECKERWKGPICNEYHGCPTNHSYFLGVCTKNLCQHDGELALGSKYIECICKAPWDGRFCDRLACWRMADKEHERRWRNDKDHCRCADNYDGENCETIVSCQNGEMVGGRCQCAEGWKGEVCDRKCTPGKTCGAFANIISSPVALLLLVAAAALLPSHQWTCHFS